MGAAPQTSTHPAQHRCSAQSWETGTYWEAVPPTALFPGLPVPQGESRRTPRARSSPAGARTHLRHSLQVPAGNDGPAAVPAGKGQVRRARLLSSTSGSAGVRVFLAGIAAVPSPQDAEPEPCPGWSRAGPAPTPAAPGASLRALPPSASHPGSSRAWQRSGERDGKVGKRREGGEEEESAGRGGREEGKREKREARRRPCHRRGSRTS